VRLLDCFVALWAPRNDDGDYRRLHDRLPENALEDWKHNHGSDDPERLMDLGKSRLGVSGFPVTNDAQDELIAFLRG
jgi:hypothetical protein